MIDKTSSLLQGFRVIALLCLSMGGFTPQTQAASSDQIARAARIDELRVALRLGPYPELFDDMIPPIVKGRAPTDAAWNPTNPEWSVVQAQVSRIFHNDIVTDPTLDFPSWTAQWNQALDQAMPENDLQTALEFLRSEAGQRFRQLDEDLQKLAAEQIARSVAPASPVPERSATDVVSPAVVSARKRVLDVILPLAHIRQEYRTLPAPSIVNSGEAVLKFMGPQLDRLAAEFAADMGAFEQFICSPAMKDLGEARRVVQASYHPNLTIVPGLAFISAEFTKHQTEWQAVRDASSATQ